VNADDVSAAAFRAEIEYEEARAAALVRYRDDPEFHARVVLVSRALVRAGVVPIPSAREVALEAVTAHEFARDLESHVCETGDPR
jgi:hypothetical protein